MTFAKFQDSQSHVMNLEKNIREQWTMEFEEYCKFCNLSVMMDYQKVIDELGRLVVMRLFELSKITASGTGMLFFWVCQTKCLNPC